MFSDFLKLYLKNGSDFMGATILNKLKTSTSFGKDIKNAYICCVSAQKLIPLCSTLYVE